MALVDDMLKQVLRDLATGKACWPLYLHGPAGGGKTSAALALCDFAKTACYETPDTLADKVMAGDLALWDWIAGTDLAVLDELGARDRVGDLHYSAVKRFADARETRAAGNRIAVYVSNLTPEQLHRTYDDRIASRLLCGTIFHLKADDRRFADR